MSRIIINFDDDIPDMNAIHYVDAVVSMGRCSGLNERSYCYCTEFKDGTVVLADSTKVGTDVFSIRRGE